MQRLKFNSWLRARGPTCHTAWSESKKKNAHGATRTYLGKLAIIRKRLKTVAPNKTCSK